MGIEFGIALVLFTALLWVVVTFAILSGIDRPERKARRQERRADRAEKRRIRYRPVAGGSRLSHRGKQSRTLHPH